MIIRQLQILQDRRFANLYLLWFVRFEPSVVWQSGPEVLPARTLGGNIMFSFLLFRRILTRASSSFSHDYEILGDKSFFIEGMNEYGRTSSFKYDLGTCRYT